MANPLGNITPIILPGSKFTSVDGAILGVANFILEVAAGFAVIAIIYSGVMYMTAGGDSAKAEKAKNNLVWAIIGVVVILLALVIIKWVQDILKGSLT